MKGLATGILFITLTAGAMAQGWIGTGNSMYSVNSGAGLTPLNVGIGTSAPTAQLHTTADVRFEGLQNDNTLERVLVQDKTGLLYWREAGTIGNNGNFWSLTGNAGTNPAVNFIGTTDVTRFAMRTANTERMTIMPNGNVGIGNINPASILTVGNAIIGLGNQTQQTYTFQVLGGAVNAVEHLGMLNNNQPSSRAEFTVSNSGNGRWEDNFVAIMVHGSNFSYQGQNNFYLNQNNAGLALLNAQSNATAAVPLTKFAIGVRNNLPLSFYTNNTERIFITGNGNVGIGTTNPDPTAILHTVGPVRFQNLPNGTGNILVIDANGNVRRSTATTRIESTDAKMAGRVAELEKEIAALKAMMYAVTDKAAQSGSGFSVYPNPAGDVVNIRLKQGTGSGMYYELADMNGRKLTDKKPFSNHTAIRVNNLVNGMYYVSIYDLQNRLVHTEKVTVSH